MQNIVIREQFDEAGRTFSRSQMVRTKAWKATLTLAGFMSPPDEAQKSPWHRTDYAQEVNFNLVAAGVRKTEAGQFHFLPLGRIAWNTVAAINNEQLLPEYPDSFDYIIPWTEHIHPQLRNGFERKNQAVERLHEAYRALGAAGLHSIER